eukprot:CAMPEP_0168623550 /NCGR_PEP_ID=MMETSP0449_2-20121227/8891_1 /TAXON_ID=1082188 /ORGANISM="Strombidium rassoulzadegani, Strain ras09" /LENGTH=40 /DNA_ID= /DNA_START= /DNA_END= /DNA_ORIENTATION=
MCKIVGSPPDYTSESTGGAGSSEEVETALGVTSESDALAH